MVDNEVSNESELHRLLSWRLDRDVTQKDMLEALGISRTAYHAQRRSQQLTSPDNLINVALFFNLNPVELLLRYRHISADHVVSMAKHITENPTSDFRRGVMTRTKRRADWHHNGPAV